MSTEVVREANRISYKRYGWTVAILLDDEFQKIEPDVSFGTTWRCDEECESFLLFEKGKEDVCLVAIYLYKSRWFSAEAYSPALIQSDPAERWVGVGIFKNDIHDPPWGKISG